VAISLTMFAFTLGGCVSDQTAVSTGEGTFMMSSWVPFGARPRAEFNAYENANRHCSVTGEKMKLVKMTSNECMLRGGCGEAKIIFSCEENDSAPQTKETNGTKQNSTALPPKPSPPPKSGFTGSGFFVSKLGHIITNEHVVRSCSSITVGDSAKKQVTVTLVETDRRNDLALLKISNTQMASVETKSLIQKLGLKLVPTASEGLLRADDAELGERVLVAGYPYGDLFSNTIKVTGGMVSANKGMGDDSGQFQIDAAVQPGNSGGPIYDENGNIVGVVVAQLNKMKFAKNIGSIPENVNFGIKGSTVRQFLTSSGLPTKWSQRSKRMNTKELAKIAKNQTVMVVCNR
jgi:serine protease Do